MTTEHFSDNNRKNTMDDLNVEKLHVDTEVHGPTAPASFFDVFANGDLYGYGESYFGNGFLAVGNSSVDGALTVSDLRGLPTGSVSGGDAAPSVAYIFANYVSKAGGTMTGALSFGGSQKATNLGVPTASGDATRKSYVDAQSVPLWTMYRNITTADAGNVRSMALVGASGMDQVALHAAGEAYALEITIKVNSYSAGHLNNIDARIDGTSGNLRVNTLSPSSGYNSFSDTSSGEAFSAGSTNNKIFINVDGTFNGDYDIYARILGNYGV